MANNRKTKTLQQGLGELNKDEVDFMDNLANSLLKIQNSSFAQTSKQEKKNKSAIDKQKMQAKTNER